MLLLGEGAGLGAAVTGPLAGGGVVSGEKRTMSTPVPCGRAPPRWSVGGAPVLSPASSAGLFISSAWVGANPPLSRNGARLGLTYLRSEATSPEISFVEPIRL